MIILLGATGYIGQAFLAELQKRQIEVVPLSRKELDYTKFESLLELLRSKKPRFLINAGGYTGKPNVDACEIARADTLFGNTLFPQMLAHACMIAQIPWGHVSSGCIYSGAKIKRNGKIFTEKNLLVPEIKKILETTPGDVHGFDESDPPNFSFRDPPTSFYSGTKALGEEALTNFENVYIWRLRIPFDQFDNPRNYLTKLQTYPKLYDNVNSVSNRQDFVRACLDLYEKNSPFGTYNVTNPGYVTTKQVVEMIWKELRLTRPFEFWKDDDEFYSQAAITPRSNCILDTSKLLAQGISLRSAWHSLNSAVDSWTAYSSARDVSGPNLPLVQVGEIGIRF